MDEIAQELEKAFYDLGVRLGRMLAEQIRADAGARRRHAPNFAGRPPPSKPKILPGLAGRRRRPGEAPPGCGRPGCAKPSRTRGYCQTHYVQWLKAGERDRRAV